MNYLLICRLMGILMLLFSAGYITAIPWGFWFSEYATLAAHLEAGGISCAISLALFYLGRREKEATLFRRESLAVVGLSWLLMAFLGALPFYLGGMVENFTDAYFESMSGLTTTGASILTDIESQPKLLLYWRSWLHFVGGLGIVVFFVAILPQLGIQGKSLYRAEVPGVSKDGFTPRIKDTAIALASLYCGLNAVLVVCLMAAGLTFFEAVNHAFATIATGGFSTKNSSIIGYNAAVQWIIILFMLLAGTNFALHLSLLRGDWRAYWRSSEFRFYISITFSLAIFTVILLQLTGNQTVSNPGGWNFRDAFFSVFTVTTSTGFASTDYDQWPNIVRLSLFFLLFSGAMAGSTSGGLKMARVMILLKASVFMVRREANPRRIRTLKIDGSPVREHVVYGVFAFFFLYGLIWAIATLLVSFFSFHQSPFSSMSAVVACMSNIGPGFDVVGPVQNYASQHPVSKWILSLCMALGRIELYPILVLFAPRFWVPR